MTIEQIILDWLLHNGHQWGTGPGALIAELANHGYKIVQAQLLQEAEDARAEALRLHREKMAYFRALLEIECLPSERLDEASNIVRRVRSERK